MSQAATAAVKTSPTHEALEPIPLVELAIHEFRKRVTTARTNEVYGSVSVKVHFQGGTPNNVSFDESVRLQ